MKLIRVSPFLLVPTYLFSLIFSAFAILVPGNLASFASVVSLSLLLAHTVLFYLVLDNKPKAAWYYGSYLAFLFALLAFFRFGMETFATFNLAGVVE